MNTTKRRWIRRTGNPTAGRCTAAAQLRRLSPGAGDTRAAARILALVRLSSSPSAAETAFFKGTHRRQEYFAGEFSSSASTAQRRLSQDSHRERGRRTQFRRFSLSCATTFRQATHCVRPSRDDHSSLLRIRSKASITCIQRMVNDEFAHNLAPSAERHAVA